MIVYLNNQKNIEEQREFGIGNFFKNIGSVFSRKPATAASPSVVSGRVKRGGNNVGLNSSSVTPVVPNTKPANTPKITVSGTNVKVDANADIQAQSLQYLNSGQVKSAQANANKITASANQGNKKFEKQQQLLNKADEANQVLNAGGNTYVMGAKSTSDIKAAINNANPVNQYQGQVTNKPTTSTTQQGTGTGKPTNVQQGTGASGAEIKQQSQNLQGQRNPNEVTADVASRNTKLTITKPKTTSNTNTQQTNTQPANNTQQTNTQQPTNNQPANNTQQTPPTPPPTTQPTNNTQSNTGQNNNTTTNNNNNNSKTGNKPNWWNRWGKTTAKVTAGVGAVGTLGAGVYGLHELHKMTSSDDR